MMEGKELIGKWLRTGEPGPLETKIFQHTRKMGDGTEIIIGEDVRATLPPDMACEVIDNIRKLSPLCRVASTEFLPDYRGGACCLCAAQVDFDEWMMQQSDEDIGQQAAERMALKFAPALEGGFVEGQGGPGVPRGMMTLDIQRRRAKLSAGEVWELARELGKYQPSHHVSFFCSHRTDYKLRQLKASEFEYLWQPSKTSEYQATMFEHPLYLSGHLPDDVLLAGTNKALSLAFFQNGFSLWKHSLGLRMQMMVEVSVDQTELRMLDWR